MEGSPGGLLMTEGPALDSAVTLMPAHFESDAPAMHAGTVRSWIASAAGLVVTSQVSTTPETVAALDGQRVWVSTDSDDGADGVRPHGVFQAVAQASRSDELSLTGVMLLVAETRRGAVRAPTEVEARLSSDTGEARTTTVDLSRTGMRVRDTADLPHTPHAPVEVSLALEDGSAVHARGEVLRVDEVSGEAVIRFVDVDAPTADRLEHSVLRELARQQRGS
ncbi:PilZ domain-containing protein [Kineococcus gynurae]|uniref:PilZ domain-containing protein n=1 Tax=Kineococcus gynurae TaxID=452979 RepID=A0ABV5LT02_9ACTN